MGTGASAWRHEIALEQQFWIGGDTCLEQRPAVALIAFMRGQVCRWPADMRNTPVTELDEVPHSHVSARQIINTDRRRRLHSLVIHNHYWKPLVIETGQHWRGRAGKYGQHTCRQLRRQHAVDYFAMILFAISVLNAIEHQFITGILEHIGHAAHQFRDERPAKRGDEHPDQLAAATGQSRSSHAGNKILDDLTNTSITGWVPSLLSCNRRYLTMDSGDRTRRSF